MTEVIILIISFFMALAALLNGRKIHKRLNTLEVVLAKKNLLTWNDPAWNLNEDDKKLIKELTK